MSITNPAMFQKVNEAARDMQAVHTRRAQRLAYTTLAALIAEIIFFLAVGLASARLATVILVGTTLLAVALVLFSIRWVNRGSIFLGVSLLVGATHLNLVINSALFAGVGIFIAIGLVVLTILEASATLDQRQTNRLVMVGLVTGFVALLVNTITPAWLPFQRFELPIANIAGPVFLAFLVVVFIFLASRQFINFSLQIKLLSAFMLATLLPLSVLSVYNVRTTTRTVRDQANQALMLSAEDTASQIDSLVRTNLNQIISEGRLPAVVDYMATAAASRKGSQEEAEALAALRTFTTKDRLNILSYALLDTNGVVALDTVDSGVGKFEADHDFFKTPLKTFDSMVSSIDFDTGNNAAYIYFSAPILSREQRLLGVIRVRYNADLLLSKLNQSMNKLGTGSYPILFDENYLRLSDPVNRIHVFKPLVPFDSQKIQFLLSNHRIPEQTDSPSSNQPELYEALKNASEQPFFLLQADGDDLIDMGAVASLETQPWNIVYLQSESSIINPILKDIQTSTVIMALIAMLSAFMGMAFSSVLSQPINQLTLAAQRITAGDLMGQVRINTHDEIETLARSFNGMTQQLRALISGLEDRVQQRTLELAQSAQRANYRATQLQTLSDVARAVSSTQDLEKLLLSVTELISERFKFYHVGVFLIDDNREYALLRAANSEGGRRMLARHHKLQVGQVGIVGYVTGAGLPRIATDVGADATFFNNPDLPLTRSEMALPLKSGDQVIGALDVQSTIAGAFSEEDTALFSTLADQIAIAIVNSRLYDEMNQALAEANDTHRKYLRQEWTHEIEERRQMSYQYTNQGVRLAVMQASPESKEAIKSGEIVKAQAIETTGKKDDVRSALAVPIKLRDEVIGVIDVQQTEHNREWFDEEVAIVQAVADQVAIALENARLFEQTVRRAERERKAMEITNKIRATNDPQSMIQTAVMELQKALSASRAQILLQPTLKAEPTNGNGHNGNGHNGSNGNNGHNGHNGNNGSNGHHPEDTL